MFFDILATSAEFKADLVKLHTREGMTLAWFKGKFRSKKSKLSDLPRREVAPDA